MTDATRNRRGADCNLLYGMLALQMNFVSRDGLLTSCSEAEPFGHNRPREIGLSGSPSIWMTFSSLT